MNKFKIFCVILALITLVPNLNSFSYAENNDRVIDLEIKEFNNTVEFNYKKIEDGKTVLYEETLSNNNINTKKFINNILIDEFDSIIITDDIGEISVEINNVRNNSTEVIKINQDYEEVMYGSIGTYAIVPSNRTRHPTDNEYYLSHGSTGHLGVEKLTVAAIVGVITTIGSGGSLVVGAVSAMAVLIVDGGFKNVYYEENTYYPYGTDMIGRPLWKRVQKVYSGNDKSRQIGSTLYYDSDLTVVR